MTVQKKHAEEVSKQALERLPQYLQYLRFLSRKGEKYASAPMIAAALHLHQVQVRKDLELVSTTGGKPRSGFSVEELIADLEQFLGCKQQVAVVLVGNTPFGKALPQLCDWKEYGVHFVAVLDNTAQKEKAQPNALPIYPLGQAKQVVLNHGARLAVLAVEPQLAQEVCDRLVEAGITAIWNFSDEYLQVPKQVLVHSGAPTLPLSVFRRHLLERPL